MQAAHEATDNGSEEYAVDERRLAMTNSPAPSLADLNNDVKSRRKAVFIKVLQTLRIIDNGESTGRLTPERAQELRDKLGKIVEEVL